MAERFRGLLRDAFRPRQIEAPPNSNLPAPRDLARRPGGRSRPRSSRRCGGGRLVTLTGAGGSGKTRARGRRRHGAGRRRSRAACSSSTLAGAARAGPDAGGDRGGCSACPTPRTSRSGVREVRAAARARQSRADSSTRAPRSRRCWPARRRLQGAGDEPSAAADRRASTSCASSRSGSTTRWRCSRSALARCGRASGPMPRWATVCERLDRLPLALELAAARVRTLPDGGAGPRARARATRAGRRTPRRRRAPQDAAGDDRRGATTSSPSRSGPRSRAASVFTGGLRRSGGRERL